MEDALNRVGQRQAELRSTSDQLDTDVILDVSSERTNLHGISTLVNNIVQWARWISGLPRDRLSALFTIDELNVIDSDLMPVLQVLLGIQNDIRNANYTSRIFTDHSNFLNEIAGVHSKLIFIGRVRQDRGTTLADARKLADEAQAKFVETQHLISREAVGTLAAHFANLVSPHIDKPKVSTAEWRSDEWYQNKKEIAEYNRKRFWNGGYESRAKRWFILTVLVSVAATFYAAFFVIHRLEPIDPKDSSTLIYAKVFLKLLALSVPLLLIRFCIKNYNAVSHLMAVNKHKEALLKTFRAMKEDMPGPAADKDVLTKLLELVGEAGETGFITKSEGAGDGAVNLNFPTKT